MTHSSSILIPSLGRPQTLLKCLAALDRQTLRPDEVLVVWQADDLTTRQAAEQFRSRAGFDLRVIHSPVRGVVPAS